jgi:glycosyltransferase involved in cell wall biosynthesis
MSYRASIVVPLLRQVDSWLEQSLLSALDQSISTEVIVVRSARTPRSNIEILERLSACHPNLVCVEEDKPDSFPAAINQGIRMAQADRIGLLLSDDWLETTAVAESLCASADIVSSGTFVHLPDGDVNEPASKSASLKGFLSCRTLEEQASYLEHFFLFRKECLLQVGGLDETLGNYPGIDDFDLIWTLLENGASVAIVERRLYHYRDHGGERLTLEDPGLMRANLQRILRKHGVGRHEEPGIIERHARWYGSPIHQVMEASRDRVADAPSSAAASRLAEQIRQGNRDADLDAMLSYATALRLDRLVVDAAVPGEYRRAPSVPGGYRATGREVACGIDPQGRWRIKIPFHLRGHLICTKPERMLGIFWCLDLLKAGYMSAHLLSRSEVRHVSVLRQLAIACLARIDWPRIPTSHRSQVRRICQQMARGRGPSYRAEPKRVLMITSTYNRGGSERQMVATAAGLIERGWDVRVMALGSLTPGDPSIEEELRNLGITPQLWSALDGESGTASGRAPSREATHLPQLFLHRLGPIRAAIRHHRPSVVHGWLDVPAVVAALAACELGVPRVVIGQRNCREAMTIQRYPADIVEALWHGYRSAAANPAVAILNNSAAGAAGYERWLRLRPGTIRVLYNGYMPGAVRTPAAVEVAQFRAALGLGPDAPVVGSVMRFVPQKDPGLWLDAAAEIAKHKPDVRFLLVGYGAMRDKIVARIAALGLGDRIVLPGPVADVGLVYAASDVILLTSLSEGVPNVLLEAQAAGRPVVASNFSSAGEALSHGHTGCVVAGRSARRLARATSAILDDPAWAARARIEGPAFVTRRFDLGRMLCETLALYGAPAPSRGPTAGTR